MCRMQTLLLSLRLALGNKIFGKVGFWGVRVSPGRIIKGPCETTELAALQYVAENTTIPVPKVLKVHDYNGRLYIELEWIRGIDLQAAWLRGNLSPDQKTLLITEIAAYISQLRNLEPPRPGFVGSASQGESLDHRVGSAPFGPFTSHTEFHSFLRRHIPLHDSSKVFGPEVEKCHSRAYRSCFTHADLSPRNIIVRDGRVAAIIDWQFGGWYPEYWEYTKAYFGQLEISDWYEGLHHAFDSYEDELKAERLLWRQCDQPGMPW
ncbi:hypothetical protein LOZ53_003223 [Ophidiomyces ophidiicola]|nr:hypothetical protein LOZ55_005227 [Ophidiomyces ophidiicola]KAI1983850.1 hypothetical protein LOZ54_004761 [Ophidiomyces ophidiicola]KAI1990344.1 hypothetical protein LOZ53_003223 [Ophidiomyces ophidiicola]KAI1998212.1 hypothetical protein LOZ51_002890 [Ophidiomyces ophidiicola]